MFTRKLFVSAVVAPLFALAGASCAWAQPQSAAASSIAPAEARWFKGNLHTHSFWSDGDDYPEMIADWYKRNGYNFLGISDHNVLQQGDRWMELKVPVSLAGSVNQRGAG